MWLETSGMTDPENWSWWLKVLLFPPMLGGAVCGWLPLAKAPKWRALQIALIAYFFLFVTFFVWKSAVGYVIVVFVSLGFLCFLFIRWRNSS
jgi:hypothetical protein